MSIKMDGPPPISARGFIKPVLLEKFFQKQPCFLAWGRCRIVPFVVILELELRIRPQALLEHRRSKLRSSQPKREKNQRRGFRGKGRWKGVLTSIEGRRTKAIRHCEREWLARLPQALRQSRLLLRIARRAENLKRGGNPGTPALNRRAGSSKVSADSDKLPQSLRRHSNKLRPRS